MPKTKHPVGEPRTLVVRTCEYLQLSEISDVSQRFTVQMYLLMAFPGGAHDEDLSARDENGGWPRNFPLRDDGVPTFLPPAGWYLDQFDMNNAISWSKMDDNIFADGDDMCIALRLEGTFYESLELQRFPFDVQSLTVEAALNCRMTGIL